jgi:DNA relaxase NicK
VHKYGHNNNNNNNNNFTISDITNQISCDKNITNSNIVSADCKQFDETTEHIISTCQILAKEQYMERYDRLCDQLRFNMCKEMVVK